MCCWMHEVYYGDSWKWSSLKHSRCRHRCHSLWSCCLRPTMMSTMMMLCWCHCQMQGRLELPEAQESLQQWYASVHTTILVRVDGGCWLFCARFHAM